MFSGAISPSVHPSKHRSPSVASDRDIQLSHRPEKIGGLHLTLCQLCSPCESLGQGLPCCLLGVKPLDVVMTIRQLVHSHVLSAMDYTSRNRGFKSSRRCPQALPHNKNGAPSHSISVVKVVTIRGRWSQHSMLQLVGLSVIAEAQDARDVVPTVYHRPPLSSRFISLLEESGDCVAAAYTD